jgi:N-ethylmaleimide reductase
MAKRSDENPARSKLFEPLVARLRTGAPLNAPDKSTCYGGGAKGYIDYPFLEPAAV